MESKRHERDGSNSDSSPVPPSPPIYSSYEITHNNKSRTNSRRSPSVTDYRSSGGRSSSRNVSPQDKRRRQQQQQQRQHRRRSRSVERSRKYSRRGRSRSRSRSRSPRVRLRSSRDRRRSRSLNRSASRSPSRSRTPSYSPSPSRSRSHSRSGGNPSREQYQERHRGRHYRATSYESDSVSQVIEPSNAALSSVPAIQIQSNAFKNDGSFMEMFKKMQEQMQPDSQPTTSVLEEKPIAPPPLMVGKRRGGRILKTGMVAKPKTGQTVEQPKDAWSLYMAEVKKYREVCCQEEDNTRPLVK